SPPAWAASGAETLHAANAGPAIPSRLNVTAPISQGRMPDSVLRVESLTAADAARYRQTGDQQHDKDHHEDEEQYLGDGNRGAGNAGKAQNTGDQADDQENEGPAQHVDNSAISPNGNAGKPDR